jgi:hypothetical protein
VEVGHKDGRGRAKLATISASRVDRTSGRTLELSHDPLRPGEFESAPIGAVVYVDVRRELINALHSNKDEFHGGDQLEPLVRYGVDSQIQQKMLCVPKVGAIAMAVVAHELMRLGLGAAELPTNYDAALA